MHDKLKVCHIINSFSTGGAEKVVLSYLEEFKGDSEYEMIAVSLAENRHKVYDKIAEQNGLHIEYLNLKRRKNIISERLYQIRSIRKYLKKKKPDIIHMHLSLLNIVCIASIGLGIRVKFHTIHSDPRVTSKGFHRIINAMYYHFFNVTAICLNDEMKGYANRLFFTNKTLVLHNGIRIEEYSRLTHDDAKEYLGFTPGQTIIGHVGRFSEVKNHKKVLSVFREIKDNVPTAVLVLVGEGGLMGKVRNQAEKLDLIDSVYFLGTRYDIPEIMRSFDCFIFPSLYEGLGIVVLEAQAAGVKCVISSNIPDEVVVSNLVKKMPVESSDESWASLVMEQLQSKAKTDYKDMEQFSMSKVCSDLKDIYAKGMYENN